MKADIKLNRMRSLLIRTRPTFYPFSYEYDMNALPSSKKLFKLLGCGPFSYEVEKHVLPSEVE
jgi:hypothetical protein